VERGWSASRTPSVAAEGCHGGADPQYDDTDGAVGCGFLLGLVLVFGYLCRAAIQLSVVGGPGDADLLRRRAETETDPAAGAAMRIAAAELDPD